MCWRSERDWNSRYDCFRHLLRLDTTATADALASLASCRSPLKNNHFTLPSNRLSKNSIEVWRFNASRPHGEAGYRDQDLCDRSTQKSLGISVLLIANAGG